MKGEYAEEHAKSETPNIFSNLNQSQSFPNHPFQPSTNDDNRNRSSTVPKPISSTGDGATIEVVRRPRGRPRGSKNKLRLPVIITRDLEPAMSPYILEVSAGNDVVEAVSGFSRQKNMGLCVLTGSGTVANVTLRQPLTTPGATVTFHGRFDILSISATFLPQHQGSSNSPPLQNSFSISLAGPQGQIIGGIVAGGLVAAGSVFVIAASFNNPSYHKLQKEEDGGNSVSGSGEGQSALVSGGGGGGDGQGESCGVSMYSCQLPSDVIWAPTARPPPPPPPY
ncbi:unnamed protein product [Lupinus luteus]|uniref:PPC domain-containing protein n=1 Tax=Lupinus luteus TaxID=3873 RepID=A0AAV1XE99_LUPLU